MRHPRCDPDGECTPWRAVAGVIFALAGATLPAAAYMVHMYGTGGIGRHGGDPYVYVMAYGAEWPARQGILIAACLGLAAWPGLGAVDRARALRTGVPATRQPLLRGRVAGLALGFAGLVVAAGVVVPAEAYRYYLLIYGPEYPGVSAHATSHEGLGWAAWDGILAVACLWSGALLLRSAVRAWRSTGDGRQP